jgi:large subunit ribosomal protein L22
MEARAYLKHARISPRKVQIVLDLIRGKDAEMAAAILKHTPKAASEPLLKLLNSAVANAVDPGKPQERQMDPDRLYVAECFAGPGPTLKRIRPRAQGRAFRIFKRTSHVTMVLKEREEE